MVLTLGNHYSVIDVIGEGSYGNVYRVKDQNGKEYAVKQIKTNKYGIVCLLEAVIMSTFDTSNINNAIDIFVTNNHMNIVQNIKKTI